jgi:hypothetical protein
VQQNLGVANFGFFGFFDRVLLTSASSGSTPWKTLRPASEKSAASAAVRRDVEIATVTFAALRSGAILLADDGVMGKERTQRVM